MDFQKKKKQLFLAAAPFREAGAVPPAKQHSDSTKPDLDVQRQSLVKRELPAFVSAVDAAAGERRGPFTVELLELKKFTG